MRIQVGTYHETGGRKVTRCPSYYAADYETLVTEKADVPLMLDVVGGYTCPMPYWLLVAVPARRIGGKLFSGFGGVNFASTNLPCEDTILRSQLYAYQLSDLVEAGKATVFPEFQGLVEDRIEWARNQTWEGL